MCVLTWMRVSTWSITLSLLDAKNKHHVHFFPLAVANVGGETDLCILRLRCLHAILAKRFTDDTHEEEEEKDGDGNECDDPGVS